MLAITVMAVLMLMAFLTTYDKKCLETMHKECMISTKVMKEGFKVKYLIIISLCSVLTLIMWGIIRISMALKALSNIKVLNKRIKR